MVPSVQVAKRRRVRLTEAQMIAKEAKLLRKMMRPSASDRLRRLRWLGLTESTRARRLSSDD